jgi:outer membrane immunogenic protein
MMIVTIHAEQRREKSKGREVSIKEDFMRCKILCAGLLASVAAGAGAAMAADIAAGVGGRPGVAAVPITPPIDTWTGFYVGIHGGGGWDHESISSSEFFNFQYGSPDGSFTIPFGMPPGNSGSGGVFGFQAGHNWQWGPVVGGLEIDFSGTSIGQTNNFFVPIPNNNQDTIPFTHDFKIDELASARGRLGYLIWQNLLLYGTAGIGWGNFRVTNSNVFTPNSCGGCFTITSSSTDNENLFGWTAGVGLEWKLAEHWLLRGEWLHYDFGKVTNPNNNAIQGLVLDNGNSRVTVDVARAAISYKFSP